jgi:hypothetical protein
VHQRCGRIPQLEFSRARRTIRRTTSGLVLGLPGYERHWRSELFNGRRFFAERCRTPDLMTQRNVLQL